MDDLRTLDVTDETTFAFVPPCADPGFDHRSCDYWEDDARGSKAARLDWLVPSGSATPGPAPTRSGNPFLEDPADDGPGSNPFARSGGPSDPNPFLGSDSEAVINP